MRRALRHVSLSYDITIGYLNESPNKRSFILELKFLQFVYLNLNAWLIKVYSPRKKFACTMIKIKPTN